MLKPIMWPVLIPTLLLSISVGVTTPVLILGALHLGASQSAAAVIVAAMGAVSLGFTVPAGKLIDRLGDSQAIMLASIGSVAVTVLTVVALCVDTPWSLGLYAASLFLRAPLQDVWSLARQALVATVMPTEHTGKAMTALGGTQRIGNLVGPLAASGLLLVWPMWTVFVFSAACALLAMVILRTPKARVFEDLKTTTEITDAARQSTKKAPSASVPLRELDVAWLPVTLAGLPVLVLQMLRSAQPVAIQLWGVQLGMSGSAISAIIAVGAVVELALMVPGAYIKDYLGRTPTMIISLTVYGCGFISMVFLPSAWGLVFSAILMSLGNGPSSGINMTIGADLSPARGRASFLGVWSLFSRAGTLSGPMVISALVATVTLGSGVTVIGVAAYVGAVWMGVFGRKMNLPPGTRSQVRTHNAG